MVSRANEKVITYLQFYDGFLAQYLKCFNCTLTRQALTILDLDHNGYISWEELVFRAKWVIKEYPDQCDTIESTITCLFQNYIMPEIAEALRKIPKFELNKQDSIFKGLKGKIELD